MPAIPWACNLKLTAQISGLFESNWSQEDVHNECIDCCITVLVEQVVSFRTPHIFGALRKTESGSIDNVDPSQCCFQVWCCSTSLLVLQATWHSSRWELFLLFLSSNYYSIVRNNRHQPSLALFPDPAQLFCRLQFIRTWESGFCIIPLRNCSRHSHQVYSEIHNQRDQDLVNVQCDPSVPEAAKSAISDIHQTGLGRCACTGVKLKQAAADRGVGVE